MTWRDNFWDAYNALDPRHSGLLADGVRHAIAIQQAIGRIAPDLLTQPASIGFMRVLTIDDMADSDRRLFTQVCVLAWLLVARL